jgi:inorganic pyrophosphatase
VHTVLCIIETPKGSRNKYEFDPKLGRIRLDRYMPSSVVYPVEYGFIPDTLGGDGDPLDVLVFVSEPTFSGCVIEVKAVALLAMEDEHGRDEKVVCVPLADPGWNTVEDMADIPEQLRDEIAQFFATYKDLEPEKHSQPLGWHGREEAEASIRAARERLGGARNDEGDARG